MVHFTEDVIRNGLEGWLWSKGIEDKTNRKLLVDQIIAFIETSQRMENREKPS